VLFRTIDGLSQRAGVPPSRLAHLVAKELADNALDEADAAGGGVTVTLGDGPNYFVEDTGRGFDEPPEGVARLFSINRPMVSAKLLRLPTRGALGNGLRVVAGAILASEGTLAVITRGAASICVPSATAPRLS
jgi:hypothetical protein